MIESEAQDILDAPAGKAPDPIFDVLEKTTSELEDVVRGAVMARSSSFELYEKLNEMKKFIVNLNVAGKIAVGQWMYTALVRDEPRGLIAYYVLDRSLNKNNKPIEAHEFVHFAARCHPAIDPKPDPKAGPSRRQSRERLIQKRIQDNIDMAKDLRYRAVSLIGNPMPSNLFTRSSLFENLSKRETLAAFIACISGHDIDWIAKAYTEAQNARALATMEQNKESYTSSLQLAEIYLQALKVHMRIAASKQKNQIPLRDPLQSFGTRPEFTPSVTPLKKNSDAPPPEVF